MTYQESFWIAKAVAPVTYHEAFWIAASAVAPVIALAAVVAMSDTLSILGDATRALASIEYSRRVASIEADYQAELAKIQPDRVAEGEAPGKAPDDVLDSVAASEAQDARKWSLIAGAGTLLNLAIQAFLLAVSLWALAYHHDVILPWAAIILGIGGIVFLAGTGLITAVQRFNLQSPLLRRKRGGQSPDTAA